MNESHPLITIGITCFNAEDTIARAINSACRQDWQNLEIIVVDDCSSDGSVAQIRDAIKKDSRITLKQHRKNGGVAVSRNSVLRLAKGKYIAFFDDDDESDQSRITKQHDRLADFEAQFPDLPVLCYCNERVLLDGKEQRLGIGVVMGHKGIGRRSPEPKGPMIADFYFFRIGHGSHVFGGAPGATTFASTWTLREFGYDPDLRRAEDWDLAIRVGLAGGFCISVDEYLVDHHVTDSDDKAGRVSLEYDLALIDKHLGHFQSARLHRAAILHAHARFHRTRNPLKFLISFSMACLLSPRMIYATIMGITNRG